MKKFFSIFFVVLIVLTGCGKNEQKIVQKQNVEVGVYTIKKSDITIKSENPGRVKAFLTAEIRPQINGIIKNKNFNDGDFVKEGDILYEIDDKYYLSLYNEAKASLKNAEALLESTKLKSNKYEKLSKINGASEQEFIDYKSSYLQSLANVEAKKASLETAKINLDYTKIVSPISGKIGTSNYTVGALVNSNQTSVLTTVRNTNKVYVDYMQSSVNYLHLKEKLFNNNLSIDNLNVSIKLENGKIYELNGVLSAREMYIDENTGSITNRTIFENKNDFLIPGMYVDVIVEEIKNSSEILIPQQSLLRDSKGNPYVYVLEKNKAISKQIKLGNTYKEKWIVENGLKENDLLIVEGTNKIKNDMEVSYVNVDNKFEK